MSSIVLPSYMAETPTPVSEPSVSEEATQLPTPCGYQMLISLPVIEDKYDSGLLKADSVVKNDSIATVVAFVLKQGPDCYKDEGKFPSGPYCKEGDFVLLQAYAGTRFKIRGVEFRFVNDDSVVGVVQDPRGYSRV